MGAGSIALDTFTTFGELLTYLRKRAQLSQRELSISVGYSESQISRLETNQRTPDQAALKALFVPALGIQGELETVQRLIELGCHQKKTKKGIVLTGKNHPNNLPIQCTSFIGREKEIARVIKLLGNHRLVTLTGSGGTGKTRLVLRIGEEVLGNYPDGVWFVELAHLVDPCLVPAAVASALNLIEIQGKSIIDQLVDFLKERQLLLILDNCEHLVEACAELVASLLSVAQGLNILATSREALWVTGERPFWVPSLDLPEMNHLTDLIEITRVESIQLFVERASAVCDDFEITADNAPIIAQICQRLDGIPLAIELAAARLRIMTIEELASRLGDVFHLLTGGNRDALPRQQTLKATMDWSYALLSEREKLVLHRLSIFIGGWTLDATEAICVGDGIEKYEVLDLLTSLVDKSLVLISNTNNSGIRYRMLETIRQYSYDCLVKTGKEKKVRSSYLAYYLQLAETFAREVRGKKQVEWLERMDLELGNLRLAMEWSLQKDVMAGLRLGTALQEFWGIHSHQVEGCAWLYKLLDKEATQRGPQQLALGVQDVDYLLSWVRATSTAISLVAGSLNEDRRTRLMQVLDLCRQLGEVASQELSFALLIAWQSVSLPSWKEGKHFLEESIQIARQKGYTYLLAKGMWFLCLYSLQENGSANPDIPLLEESLALFRRSEDPDGIALCLHLLRMISRSQGKYSLAYSLAEQALDIFQRVGDQDLFNIVLIQQSYNLLELKKPSQAIQMMQCSLNYFRRKGDEIQLCYAILQSLEIDYVCGNYRHGEALAKEACQLSLKGDNQVNIAASFVYLALYKYKSGHLADAIHLLVMGSTRLTEQEILPVYLLILLVVWVVLLGEKEKWELVAELCGAIDDTYQQFVGALNRLFREYPITISEAARLILGEEAFNLAWKGGQALTMWQALQIACQDN